MKRLITILIGILITGVLFAQTENTFKYVINANGGIVVPASGLKIGAVTVTATGTQLNFVDATSSIQGQLNAVRADLNDYVTLDTAAMLTPYVNHNDTISMLTKYVRKASPTLTGVPAAPTAAVGTNTTQIATTAFVHQGTVRKILSSNEKISNTGNTNENTILTATIPGGSIGVNGSFHIIALWTANNNANAKTYKVKFNGTIVLQLSMASTATTSTYTVIRNRNSASVQVSANNASLSSDGGFGMSSSLTPSTYTFDTTADITVTVTMTNADAGDTISMEAFEIIAYY
jgi:hypothetical protein